MNDIFHGLKFGYYYREVIANDTLSLWGPLEKAHLSILFFLAFLVSWVEKKLPSSFQLIKSQGCFCLTLCHVWHIFFSGFISSSLGYLKEQIINHFYFYCMFGHMTFSPCGQFMFITRMNLASMCNDQCNKTFRALIEKLFIFSTVQYN